MGKNILIIDDEPDIRFLLTRFLASYEYVVREAGSLLQGFELYNTTSPDIIILDAHLPDGNGANYACKFKNGKTAVILISADNDQLTEIYKEVGADAFLRKPFAPDELINIINKVQENIPNDENAVL